MKSGVNQKGTQYGTPRLPSECNAPLCYNGMEYMPGRSTNL